MLPVLGTKMKDTEGGKGASEGALEDMIFLYTSHPADLYEISERTNNTSTLVAEPTFLLIWLLAPVALLFLRSILFEKN